MVPRPTTAAATTPRASVVFIARSTWLDGDSLTGRNDAGALCGIGAKFLPIGHALPPHRPGGQLERSRLFVQASRQDTALNRGSVVSSS